VLALPDIPERGLGSCAVVGNSDNLLGAGRGPQIDDHDTVLRHNTPMRGFETDVGSRRSVVYMKSKYSKAPPKGMAASLKDVELALAELKDVTEVPLSYRGAAGSTRPSPPLSLSLARPTPPCTRWLTGGAVGELGHGAQTSRSSCAPRQRLGSRVSGGSCTT
jgi:hypothetical protein